MKTTAPHNKTTFTVPDGYEMAGTKFSISDIEVDDHPDGSEDGLLTYELYHEDDVDGKELGKIINQVILDALERQVRELNESDD